MGQMHFLSPKRQHQNTEGKPTTKLKTSNNDENVSQNALYKTVAEKPSKAQQQTWCHVRRTRTILQCKVGQENQYLHEDTANLFHIKSQKHL